MKINIKIILFISLIFFVILFTIYIISKPEDPTLNLAQFTKIEENIPEVIEETATPEIQSIRNEEAKKQTEADKSFVIATNKVEKKYPWFHKFPIESEEYTIVYDYEQDSFRIRFKVEYTKEKENEIVQKIKEIVGDTTFDWYVIN